MELLIYEVKLCFDLRFQSLFFYYGIFNMDSKYL